MNGLLSACGARLKGAVLILCALIASALILKFVPLPYIWISALCTALCFVAAARTDGWQQTTAIVAASFCLAACVGEGVATIIQFGGRGLPSATKTIVDVKYTTPDKNLGWRHVPGVSAAVRKLVGDTAIYDVRYTIDAQGNRIAPAGPKGRTQGCAVFFGGSFTFGQGVNDSAAYPYQVGLRTAGKFRIMNLGVGGYGPHHMLAMLERGDVAASVSCKPSHVFHLALPHHVMRVAGKAVRGGPVYALGSDGKLQWRRQSKFQMQLVRLANNANSLLQRSSLYRFLAERDALPSEADLSLYFAVLSRTNELAAAQWKGAELHILAWNIHPWYSRDFKTFLAGLSKTGWRIHEITNVLPGYDKEPERYGLHPSDLHPNPLAYNLVAAYIADRVLLDKP